MLGPPPDGVQQPFPAQQVPELPAATPQIAGAPAGQLQVPEPHAAPAAQVTPQPPQFAGSVWTSMQADPQYASPVGQHWPDVHVCPAPHALPHEPRFASSVWRSAQVVGLESGHCVVPCGHWQLPPTHASCASVHATPHAPQFAGSVSTSLQTPPHSSYGAAQVHVPLWQVWCATQAFPHWPQLRTSVPRSAQRGFDASHRVRGAAHAQAPPVHVPPLPQEMPHPPQLDGSAWYDAGSTQNPLHFTCPEGQLDSELEDAHAASAAARRATRARVRIMAAMIRHAPRR